MNIDSRRGNLPPLELHIPEPPARPGEEADFSHIGVLAAGVTPRPDSSADTATLRDMAYGLVRVLDGQDELLHEVHRRRGGGRRTDPCARPG